MLSLKQPAKSGKTDQLYDQGTEAGKSFMEKQSIKTEKSRMEPNC